MTLELWNTFATFGTFVVIAATAIAALIQLGHLRAGNQINAMLSIGEELRAKPFMDAQYLVRHRLEAALNHPAFRNYIIGRTPDRPLNEIPQDHDELRHAANFVANALEELGILVKNGILDQDIFFDRYCALILADWGKLANFIGLVRDSVGTVALWENFEYLAVLSEDWMRAHPSGSYPKQVRRMPVRNPWPIAPQPATA